MADRTPPPNDWAIRREIAPRRVQAAHQRQEAERDAREAALLDRLAWLDDAATALDAVIEDADDDEG